MPRDVTFGVTWFIHQREDGSCYVALSESSNENHIRLLHSVEIGRRERITQDDLGYWASLLTMRMEQLGITYLGELRVLAF